MNVMAPTMQVACKAFIAPNSAARSPKERFTHVPHSLRRVRFCGQDWDSHFWSGPNATSLWPLATAKALGLDIPPTISHSRMKSSSNPPLRLWVNRVDFGMSASCPVSQGNLGNAGYEITSIFDKAKRRLTGDWF